MTNKKLHTVRTRLRVGVLFLFCAAMIGPMSVAAAQDSANRELRAKVTRLEREIAQLRNEHADSGAYRYARQTRDSGERLTRRTLERKSTLRGVVGSKLKLAREIRPGDRPEETIPESPYLELGVDEDFSRYERLRLKDQILTFIPPLYQPAFLGHAYVLPPRTFRVTTSMTFAEIGSSDFFKGGSKDFTHENHRVRNRTANLDIFYGLDHNLTLRLNIPYVFNSSEGSVHPNGVPILDAFIEGNTRDLGDISVFLKKKWLDQGNHPVGFATVVGIQFPTGSNDKKFDFPVSLKNNMTGTFGPIGGTGIFNRFSDDGRLPAPLQPGTGGFGAHLGAFVTRQFSGFPSALHVGTLATFLEGDDGVDPGDRVKFFATYVKPVYKDHLSLELGVNGMWKDDDEYSGLFSPPPAMVPVPRPPFQGGTVVFASPSIIFNPTPQIRFHLSGSFRLNDPDRGPWPSQIIRLGSTVTF